MSADTGKAVAMLEDALYRISGRSGSGELVRNDDWVRLTTPDAPTHFRNGVLRSVLATADLDARIDETIAHYAALGVPFRWFVTPATRPADTGEALLRSGFKHLETLEGMLAAPADFPEPGRDDVEVVAVDADRIDEFVTTLGAGWSMPAAGMGRFRQEVTREIAREPRVGFYFVAHHEGRPVGTTSVRLFGDYAFMSGAEVLAEFRGRGIYTEMLNVRMRFLRERGYELALNHCLSHTSAPICRKLGFRTACKFEIYTYGV